MIIDHNYEVLLNKILYEKSIPYCEKHPSYLCQQSLGLLPVLLHPVVVGILHLLCQLYHQLTKHQRLHIHPQDVKQLPVPHVQPPCDIIQCSRNPALMCSTTAKHHVSYRRGGEEKSTVEKGET